MRVKTLLLFLLVSGIFAAYWATNSNTPSSHTAASTGKKTKKKPIPFPHSELTLGGYLQTIPPPQWMYDQIHADLAKYSASGIDVRALDREMEREQETGFERQLVRYKIRGNQIAVSDYLNPPPATSLRIQWVTEAIERLAKEVSLPDTDFIVTMHDALDNQPLEAPVFAFAKDPATSPMVVLIPDFEALHGRPSTLRHVMAANARFPWETKWEKSVWRGSRTGSVAGAAFTPESFLQYPRSKTVHLSLENPELIDARFTTHAQEGGELHARFPDYFGNFLSEQDQIPYKYQLLIDGNSCAYAGAYWRWFSNCVVLKQSSTNIQWYYEALSPFVHYIPVDHDMGNLVERLRWARDHDAEAKSISMQAQGFALENLNDYRIMQYLYLTLTEYSRLLNNCL